MSELYPPAVGGSAVLFANIYPRVPQTDVTVLTDDRLVDERANNAVTIVRRRLRTSWWGLTHPRGLSQHARTAFTIRHLAARMEQAPVVHCGRILPEGVAARFARMAGGPPFLCWAHGEDLAFMATSRDLRATARWVLRGADGVIANSENTKAHLPQYGIAPDRAMVVYPGVDCRRFHPDLDGQGVRAHHGLAGTFVVLSVGRLQARKGHDVAIRAIAALAGEHPTLRYLIVGDGEERARLEELAAGLGVGERVIFVGEVDDDLLPRYYAACDLFLLANRVERGDFEGFGIVFLEAAACGKPVIGGASGGVIEAVEHGLTGTLVDGANVDAVSGALANLLRDPERRRAYGDEGRRRAVERFSWEAAAARVRTLHDGVR